jgi:prevent-host-death family protein
MQTIPIHQAKDRFSALLQAVEEGEEIVITRHGKKIARIVRETEADTDEAERERLRRQALADLEEFRARVAPDPEYRKGDWKKYRDEGRKY